MAITLPERRAALGRTALTVARLRARESERPDGLVRDPWARSLVDAFGTPSEDDDDPAMTDQVAVRSRYYDEYLLRARTWGCTQVVLLAAGLDTRAFRLSWPWPTTLFELDRPEILEAKDAALARLGAHSRCVRVAVPADLEGAWLPALDAAGFRRELATAWLAEGILGYLTDRGVEELVDQVARGSGPGSTLATEFLSSVDVTLMATAEQLPDAPGLARWWAPGAHHATAAHLRRRGWRVSGRSRAEVAGALGRAADLDTGGGFLVASAP